MEKGFTEESTLKGPAKPRKPKVVKPGPPKEREVKVPSEAELEKRALKHLGLKPEEVWYTRWLPDGRLGIVTETDGTKPIRKFYFTKEELLKLKP